MKYQDASITATFNDQTETVDLEQVGSEDGMWDYLITVFVPDSEDNGNSRDEVQAGTTFTDPAGFAVHLFDKSKNGDTLWNPSDSFDELLEAWSDESDDDRREAMGEYLDDMGADDLSDFDEAYRGQYADGAAFAEELAEQIGAVPHENTWICIDWDATWERNLRHDYHITDSGHVFRNL